MHPYCFKGSIPRRWGRWMAKLFLSYSRKDEARARRLSHWLEREDHDVWRDEDDIGGGASFSSEIESALKDCEAVLVLWSANSVQSAWVRDEAAYGRDAGKLIPFSLDGTEPPLGFRQFQSIDLSRWKTQREPPDADRIRRAIFRIAGQACAEPGPEKQRPTGRSRKLALTKPLLVGTAVVILAASALGLFLWRKSFGEQQVAIAIMPSSQSPDRAMAADYANVAAADMAAFLPRRFDRASVVAPSDATARTSGYRMEISTDPHGPAANASLTLLDEDGQSTLWSKNWSVADASAADLKAQVSAFASKAAYCLTKARGGSNRLSQPALGLFLSGCAGFGDTKLSDVDFDTIFERVTKLAPDFAPGWAYLALSRASFANDQQDASPAAHAAAVQSARQAIAIARKMDPNSAYPYHAEYHLLANGDAQALGLLQKAAKLDPDDGLIQMHVADELTSVGRMAEAVQAAQRAVELEPGAPYARGEYIQALTYCGQFSRAKAELAEARKRWPSDPAIDLADFSLQFRYGDPRAALELLPRMGVTDADMEAFRKAIAARLDPTPANVDQAIAATKARWGSALQMRNRVLLLAGNLGKVDEAYKLLEDPNFQPFVERDALFRPDFRAVRADPRFMGIAAKLGLVRYWRQSGSWPDFCKNDKLPYDCKTEAAKYPN